MKNIIRFTVAVFVAVVTALSINFAALAVSGPYAVTESPLTHWLGVRIMPTKLTNAACLNSYSRIGTDGSCAFIYGSATNISYWRWATTKAHTYKIYAYGPRIGESIAKYRWMDINEWTLNVNQANRLNQGIWVYIGFSDYTTTNKGGYLILSNDCRGGWTCGKRVFWDSMRYTTTP